MFGAPTDYMKWESCPDTAQASSTYAWEQSAYFCKYQIDTIS